MNRQKQIIFSAFSFLFTFLGCSQSDDTKKTTTPTTQDYDLDETALATQGFSKIYEENFTAGLSQWQIWEGGAFNEELQLYRKQNLILSDGILEIKAIKQYVTGPILPDSDELSDYDYTSGRIESDFAIAATDANPKIRISARIKLPEAYGMWPAFWSYGNPWPTHGEIDILEATGDKHNYITNYYYGSQADTPVTNDDLTSEEINTAKNLTNSYHVYELIWTKTSLTFLLDGEVMESKVATQPGQQYIPAMFGKTQNIILNLAVGGGMFNNLDPSKIQPSSMYVDWVKVFRAD
ncbi:glycoside hydrolase family 16 protein [Flavobacterium sp. DG1-102-2]|uniref:glycoside hydrolase family 16 protein n=1 Tax=Flavobacterium sp. DG1-102-2 TaxID=3081663 RepID=UPI002948EF4E|nr:glycoside hydrolase family 16 protein [Flavobacterium sp. DG1-102-2]MDV6169418.1 glycoside hydrolase family 16 protein [Flavobacterium sp. DG1-102-2]